MNTDLQMIDADEIDELREEFGELNERLKEHDARLEVEERAEWAVETFDAKRYYLSLHTSYKRLTPAFMRLLADEGLYITREGGGEWRLERERDDG